MSDREPRNGADEASHDSGIRNPQHGTGSAEHRLRRPEDVAPGDTGEDRAARERAKDGPPDKT